jgi:Putative Ig domain
MKKTYTLWFLLAIGIFISGCGATNGSPVEITTGDLPSAQVAGPYVAAVKAKGGIAPYSWSLKKGSWPHGVTLSTAGAISGAPTETGAFPVTVGVSDSSIPPTTTSQTFTLQVATLQVVITTTSLPSGAVSLPYSSTLGAANGAPPYTWSVTSGQLPQGISLQTDFRWDDGGDHGRQLCIGSDCDVWRVGGIVGNRFRRHANTGYYSQPHRGQCCRYRPGEWTIQLIERKFHL